MDRVGALVPTILEDRGNGVILNLVTGLLGVVSLVLLAQLAFPLPWTPVPITGQSFGVVLMALLFGRKRGIGIVGIYLLGGIAGLPFFALGQAGWSFGPTSGYLVGMALSVLIVGGLVDRGWTLSFRRAWLAGAAMTAVIFGCGILWLSFFMPADQLLMAGLIPFLPGAVIKITLAAGVAVAGKKCI